MSEPSAEREPSANAPDHAAGAAPPEEGRAGPVSSGELFHSRGAREHRSWVWIALPVAGLSIVPVVGLVYATTSSFGRDEPAGSAVPIVGGEAPDGVTTTPRGLTTPPAAKDASKPKLARGAKGSQKPRLDSASVCCAKLHQLGKTAEVDARATFLAAASLCDAAEDEEKAFEQVGRAIRTARLGVPEECTR